MLFQFSGFADFFSMNGHGPYVWASYLVVFVVLLWLIIAPVVQMRKLRRTLMRQRQAELRRRHGHKSTRIETLSAVR